jgi:hypothetical protein
MMWVEITNAKYLDGYKMFLVFNDGQKRIFDFLPLIERYPVFKPLKDLGLFKSFTVTDTLEWADGNIDIAPEYIYENGIVA